MSSTKPLWHRFLFGTPRAIPIPCVTVTEITTQISSRKPLWHRFFFGTPPVIRIPSRWSKHYNVDINSSQTSFRYGQVVKHSCYSKSEYDKEDREKMYEAVLRGIWTGSFIGMMIIINSRQRRRRW